MWATLDSCGTTLELDQREIGKFREERSEEIDAFLEQPCWQRIKVAQSVWSRLYEGPNLFLS